MTQTNVVNLYNNDVSEKINEWLDFVAMKSINTMKAYKHDVEVFYKKQIQFINYYDLNKTDFQMFKDFVKENVNKIDNKTIRRRLSAVREMIRFLSTKDHLNDEPLIKDISYLESVTALAKQLPMNDNHYGRMSVQEVRDMANWALNNEKQCADLKFYLILFSLDTCARLGACLNLKWSNFGIVDEQGEVQINYVGKGKKDTRPKIKKWFYDELVSKLKDKYNSEFVFPLSASSINGNTGLIVRYRKAFNIPDERNIVFHSIRGAGALFAYRINGNDIMAAKKALNHANIQTTANSYLENADTRAMGAVSMMHEIDAELYKKVDQNLLLQAINEITGDFRLILNLKLNEIINKNK